MCGQCGCTSTYNNVAADLHTLSQELQQAIAQYNNQKIVLVDDKAIPEGQRKATIKQEIRSSDSIYPLEYSLARKKSGEWMVVNVIINGINLGKTFRNQFAQSAQRAGGDIDQVISGWSSSNL